MRISAKTDYAVRAVVELATSTDEKPIRAERIANAQGIPLNFLENILGEEQVTVADVASGRLPKSIDKLADDPEAWVTGSGARPRWLLDAWIRGRRDWRCCVSTWLTVAGLWAPDRWFGAPGLTSDGRSVINREGVCDADRVSG